METEFKKKLMQQYAEDEKLEQYNMRRRKQRELRINELKKKKTEYEDKKKEVFGLCDSVLKKIYDLQTEYNRKNRKGLYLIEKGFDRFKTDNCEIKYLSNGFPVEIKLL